MVNLDYELPDEYNEVAEIKAIYRSRADIEKEVKKAEKEMKRFAEELNFEQAIKMRDEVKKLKMLLLEF